ncbi:MAG: DUF2961 domain-containing protein [Armatimonadota bacterium]|nr:DUF2961 domain-containing protein [Armatimonadota bacterium]
MNKLCMLMLCCAVTGTNIPMAGAETLAYVDLVHRLTDLDRLAVLPQTGEKIALFSSYDRTSRYDAATDKYIRWDANGDGGHVIRTEGDVQVLAEMDGPGCICRIWSATAGDGRVKIYLDGAVEPAVDLPFKEYFSGKEAPFNYPLLVYKTEANGFDNFVPIPYQKSCKIVAEKGWGNYYQFTYSSFAPGTVVPTFTRALGEPEKAALAAADKLLTDNLGSDPAGARAGEATLREAISLEPGSQKTIPLQGPRAITALRAKLDPASATAAATPDSTVLRDVALRIRWDGEKSPSVAVPLGDFFGNAPSIASYKSLPSGLTPDGFYAFWYMPFARSAEVQIANEGKTPVALEISLTHAPLSRPIESLGRFHAKWHRDALLPMEPERKIDWTLLNTQGRGRFCGVLLHVWNPTRRWWGEGDEKFFVDGEKFPSTFGTGSEDYFGYAWSSFKVFVRPLHGQPQSDGRQLSDYRWHISDSVPFQQSFDGAIEKYFRDPTRYASTVYWYLAADGVDPYELAPVAERSGYYELPPSLKVAGAIEGEALRVLEKSGGNTGEQDMAGYADNWSGPAQLWWTGAKPGDKLTLALPVKDAGKYEVKAQFTKAKDYGIVQLYLDDQKLGEPVDFYNDQVIATGLLSLGTRDLTAGEHKFTMEIVGANEKAAPGYMVGLDFVKLELVQP